MNRNFCSACGLWVLVTQRLCPSCGNRSFSQSPPNKRVCVETVDERSRESQVEVPPLTISDRLYARASNLIRALRGLL